jgi:O-antigen/teichoic acid export membrane protein
MSNAVSPDSTDEDHAASERAHAKGVLAGSVLLTAARITAQITALIVLVIAVRVMTPAELGAFGLVAATALVLLQAAETGWFEMVANAKRHQALPGEYFWCAMATGGLAMLAGLGVALGIWLFARSADHAVAMGALGIIIASQPFICVQAGVLSRQGRVGLFGACQIAGELGGLAIGVYGLLSGWGIFALVAQKITVAMVAATGAGVLGRWIPAFSWRLEQVRETFHFSLNLLGTRSVGFINQVGGDYLIALFLGLAPVGFYRLASRISGAAAEVISEPARLMAWSILPRAYGAAAADAPGPKALSDMLLTLFAIAAPVFVGLILVTEPLVAVLTGPGWGAAGPALALFCLVRFLYIPSTLATVVLIMRNKTRTLFFFNLSVMLIALGFVLMLARFGLYWAVAGQLLVGLFVFGVSFRFLIGDGQLPWKPFLKDVIALSVCLGLMAAAASVALAVLADASAPVRLAAAIGAGGLAYLVAALVVRPRPVVLLLDAVRAQRS